MAASPGGRINAVGHADTQEGQAAQLLAAGSSGLGQPATSIRDRVAVFAGEARAT